MWKMWILWNKIPPVIICNSLLSINGGEIEFFVNICNILCKQSYAHSDPQIFPSKMCINLWIMWINARKPYKTGSFEWG